MAKLLDGKACSKEIEAELKELVPTLSVTPTLALLLVGTNQDSKTYVRLKKNACTRVGITPQVHELAESVEFAKLLALILPLPDHLKPYEEELLETISPFKDVDGLHSRHFARLAEPKKKENRAVKTLQLQPCTPAGCLEILARNGIELAGKDVVVIGRGQLVGLPLSLMLLLLMPRGQGSTGGGCGDWLAEGAVVVDVGISYVDDATSKKGYKILGDVDFAAASQRVSAITPVPGGIGPMTIAMLLKNTVECAKFVASQN
ncbi:Tetrahydrofolate dehydrogenase/cyclohydrolase, conserved site [Phytophthora cactorum]|nr:Tetrahydrofolate dehydrogenase/cyclohydrolase, conserved site [Phytophthora cactorum]